MPDLWKEVASWLAEATRSAIKETEDFARRGRLKFDVLGINTALQDKFAALGGVIYSMASGKENPSAIFKDPRVKKLLVEISELEGSLKEARKAEGGAKTSIANKAPVSKQGKRVKKETGKKKTAPARSATTKSTKKKKSKK